jgi:hypothetical protein
MSNRVIERRVASETTKLTSKYQWTVGTIPRQYLHRTVVAVALKRETVTCM